MKKKYILQPSLFNPDEIVVFDKSGVSILGEIEKVSNEYNINRIGKKKFVNNMTFKSIKETIEFIECVLKK